MNEYDLDGGIHMHTSTRWVVFAGFYLVALTGCVSLTQSIAKDEVPAPRDAYVYGRFSMSTHKTAFGTHASIGFIFDCKSHASYTIGLSVDSPIQVIKLPGGDVCWLSSLVYIDSVGWWAGSDSDIPPQLSRALRLDAGKAYYLGDFAGALRSVDSERMSLRLTDVRDNFVRTTAEMRFAFRNMSAITVEKKMLH